ncbi:MAG TPA: TIGR02594 family protein [Polyangiaceae bacterium]
MVVLKLNDRNSHVRQLQLLLNSAAKPLPKLKVDGHFGERTHQVLIGFQKSKGLTPDGRVGPQTRAALGLTPVLIAQPTVEVVTSPRLTIATAELGVHENSLPGHHNARILEYHQTTTLKATTDETAWCSSFVNWVVRQAGGTGTNNALAKSWLDWGATVTNPIAGDIVVIKKKTPGMTQATGSTTGFHVGFYVSSSGTHIRILGGNQSDQVKYSNFSLAAYEVQGYRR